MSETVEGKSPQTPYRLEWLILDDETTPESQSRSLLDMHFDAIPLTSFASFLLEEKQAMHAAAAKNKFLEARAFDSPNKIDGSGFYENWDTYDFIAVVGILIALLGFALVFVPAARSGGILFPIGVGLTATAAYGAQRKDRDDN
jgi:hypothetical protein